MTATNDTAYFCPTCGSSAVNYTPSELHSNSVPVSCRGCKWSGGSHELLGMPFAHTFGGREEVMDAFINDLRSSISKHYGPHLVAILVKWGFLPQPVRAPDLLPYLTRVLQGVALALIEERERREVTVPNKAPEKIDDAPEH